MRTVGGLCQTPDRDALQGVGLPRFQLVRMTPATVPLGKMRRHVPPGRTGFKRLMQGIGGNAFSGLLLLRKSVSGQPAGIRGCLNRGANRFQAASPADSRWARKSMKLRTLALR